MKKHLLILVLYAVLPIFCYLAAEQPIKKNVLQEHFSLKSPNSSNVLKKIVSPVLPWPELGAEQTIKLLASSYPELIIDSGYSLKDQKWFIKICNDKKITTLYWHFDRILPLEEFDNFYLYDPFICYRYSDKNLDPKNYTDSYIKTVLKSVDDNNPEKNLKKSINFFINAAYGNIDSDEIDKNQVEVEFLGSKFFINKRLVEPLANVEYKINEKAKNDRKVSYFLYELYEVTGFEKRKIRSSENSSMHSWGLAVDLMPILWGRHIYWMWSKAELGDAWVTVPLKKRWIPPQAVIKIFESEGFIWGGNWEIWDNMHFEYRPELLNLNKNSH